MSMKSRISKMVLILAIPMALAACKTTEQALMESGNKPLVAAEITSLHSGKAVAWTTSKASGTASYNADNSAILNWGQGDKPGMWRVDADANKLCTKWEYNKKKEKCFSVYKTAENTYETINAGGSRVATYSIK